MGSRRRRAEKLERQGFEDALVSGVRNPGLYETCGAGQASGPGSEPAYLDGFRRGEGAVKRIVKLSRSGGDA